MYVPEQAWIRNVHKTAASVMALAVAFISVHIHPTPQDVDLHF
jgi:hypothetical protein